MYTFSLVSSPATTTRVQTGFIFKAVHYSWTAAPQAHVQPKHGEFKWEQTPTMYGWQEYKKDTLRLQTYKFTTF